MNKYFKNFLKCDYLNDFFEEYYINAIEPRKNKSIVNMKFKAHRNIAVDQPAMGGSCTGSTLFLWAFFCRGFQW